MNNTLVDIHDVMEECINYYKYYGTIPYEMADRLEFLLGVYLHED